MHVEDLITRLHQRCRASPSIILSKQCVNASIQLLVHSIDPFFPLEHSSPHLIPHRPSHCMADCTNSLAEALLPPAENLESQSRKSTHTSGVRMCPI